MVWPEVWTRPCHFSTSAVRAVAVQMQLCAEVFHWEGMQFDVVYIGIFVQG